MNENNNNMNGDYMNNPVQPADGNMYQEVSGQPQEQNAPQQPNTMYHYNEQGVGQYQPNAQNAGQPYQYNDAQQNANQQYQYNDAQQNANQQYQYNDAQQNMNQQYQYNDAQQNMNQQYQYNDAQQNANQQYQYNGTQQNAGQQYNTYNAGNAGDQFTGGNQNYQYSYPSASAQPPAHGKAIASLILGIAGLVCCGVCGLIGLILAISAKNEGNDEGIRKAGFILGIIGCVIWGIGIIIAIFNGAFSSSIYY